MCKQSAVIIALQFIPTFWLFLLPLAGAVQSGMLPVKLPSSGAGAAGRPVSQWGPGAVGQAPYQPPYQPPQPCYQQLQAPAMIDLQITPLPGTTPGTKMAVRLPDGRATSVTVPDWWTHGSFKISVPAART